jgi:hypothetical protein
MDGGVSNGEQLPHFWLKKLSRGSVFHRIFTRIRGDSMKACSLVKFAVYWEYTKQELHHSTQSLMEWLNGLIRHLQLCLQPKFQSTKTIEIPTSHIS